MLYDISFIADWKKIGEHRQSLTDLNTAHENEGRIDYDYKFCQKILVRNEVIYSARQSADGRKTPGQLQQSIQMEQLRFNAETKKKDQIVGK